MNIPDEVYLAIVDDGFPFNGPGPTKDYRGNEFKIKGLKGRAIDDPYALAFHTVPKEAYLLGEEDKQVSVFLAKGTVYFRTTTSPLFTKEDWSSMEGPTTFPYQSTDRRFVILTPGDSAVYFIDSLNKNPFTVTPQSIVEGNTANFVMSRDDRKMLLLGHGTLNVTYNGNTTGYSAPAHIPIDLNNSVEVTVEALTDCEVAVLEKS
jgi:hypothetical protein